jgi:hypothetical protein
MTCKVHRQFVPLFRYKIKQLNKIVEKADFGISSKVYFFHTSVVDFA